MNLLEEDTMACLAADRMGREVVRRRVIEIDAKLLPKEYLRLTPDYSRLRKALEDGVNVPGAKLTTDVEFVLRKRGQETE